MILKKKHWIFNFKQGLKFVYRSKLIGVPDSEPLTIIEVKADKFFKGNFQIFSKDSVGDLYTYYVDKYIVSSFIFL